jgi:arylsulfatase
MSVPRPPLLEDRWELYADTDWTQAHDLSADMPEKLAALQQLWLIEVSKYNVLPLDDRRVERFNSDIAGRPTLIKGTQQILFNGMRRLSENSVLNLKNKSHTVTSEIVVAEHASGVIVAQGGEFGGWSLYLVDGQPRYCYNLFGLQRYHVRADATVPAGTHQVRVEFTYDGGGLAKGGSAALYIDGSKVGEGRLDATVPMIFSGDETCDLGSDTGSAVSDDYTSATSQFTGTVNWVQLDIADDDHDHFITAEERMRVAMARQ